MRDFSYIERVLFSGEVLPGNIELSESFPDFEAVLEAEVSSERVRLSMS